MGHRSVGNPNSGLGYAGQQEPQSSNSDYNKQRFLLAQRMARMRVCTLVQVMRVTSSGSVAVPGLVDLLPLVNMQDGNNNSFPHGVIANCPYFRYQAGGNAIILDPQVGDIGMAAFADRDISGVIATQGQANPGSNRKNDMSDALYFGGFLGAGGVPTQFVQFNEAGLTITSPNAVTVNGDTVTVNAQTATIAAAVSAIITAPSIIFKNAGTALKALLTSAAAAVFNGHTHPVSGGSTSAPNQTMSGSDETTVVMAE